MDDSDISSKRPICIPKTVEAVSCTVIYAVEARAETGSISLESRIDSGA